MQFGESFLIFCYNVSSFNMIWVTLDEFQNTSLIHIAVTSLNPYNLLW